VGAWKAVIYLNLVRSVNFVLDLLQDDDPSTTSSSRVHRLVPGDDDSSNNLPHLRIRLAPLREVEQILTRHFCPLEIGNDAFGRYREDRASEVSVRGLSGWKTLLKHRRNSQIPAISNDLDSSQRVIEACKEDMTSLWENPVIQAGLQKHDVQLQDQSGLSVKFIQFLSINKQPYHSCNLASSQTYLV
jgi:guanine nucleotide-binding protein subunit alpha